MLFVRDPIPDMTEIKVFGNIARLLNADHTHLTVRLFMCLIEPCTEGLQQTLQKGALQKGSSKPCRRVVQNTI
jgi:hypothetical protein